MRGPLTGNPHSTPTSEGSAYLLLPGSSPLCPCLCESSVASFWFVYRRTGTSGCCSHSVFSLELPGKRRSKGNKNKPINRTNGEGRVDGYIQGLDSYSIKILRKHWASIYVDSYTGACVSFPCIERLIGLRRTWWVQGGTFPPTFNAEEEECLLEHLQKVTSAMSSAL